MRGCGSTDVCEGPKPEKNDFKKSVWKKGLAVKSAGTLSEAGGVAEKTEADAVCDAAAVTAACTVRVDATRATRNRIRRMSCRKNARM